jgi:hypothetical protein
LGAPHRRSRGEGGGERERTRGPHRSGSAPLVRAWRLGHSPQIPSLRSVKGGETIGPRLSARPVAVCPSSAGGRLGGPHRRSRGEGGSERRFCPSSAGGRLGGPHRRSRGEGGSERQRTRGPHPTGGREVGAPGAIHNPRIVPPVDRWRAIPGDPHDPLQSRDGRSAPTHPHESNTLVSTWAFSPSSSSSSTSSRPWR